MTKIYQVLSMLLCLYGFVICCSDEELNSVDQLNNVKQSQNYHRYYKYALTGSACAFIATGYALLYSGLQESHDVSASQVAQIAIGFDLALLGGICVGCAYKVDSHNIQNQQHTQLINHTATSLSVNNLSEHLLIDEAFFRDNNDHV